MLILIIDVFVCITDKENNIKRKKKSFAWARKSSIKNFIKNIMEDNL